jgi:uncharacterized Zn finger protein
MSEIREFFRHCPACGRRFHIRLVGEKLVGQRMITEKAERSIEVPLETSSTYAHGGIPMPQILADEEVPVTIDAKDFRYTYKCKHCGHVWSEIREKVSEV